MRDTHLPLLQNPSEAPQQTVTNALHCHYFDNYDLIVPLFASAVNNRRAKTLDFCEQTLYNAYTALGGELAVPCYLQSATVGLNVAGGFMCGKP